MMRRKRKDQDIIVEKKKRMLKVKPEIISLEKLDKHIQYVNNLIDMQKNKEFQDFLKTQGS